ncbi:cytoskeleton-associated protein 2-like isoform X2 [Alligator sinensis]|uniref:Cytoskeleton-associated protein 2-like isoform X2 n=1 Tax=Alligator sinensis TaxID=38654 RepID=A0A1U7SPJ1_ALLSI|nr:cytoskeleton-associated protein 2-like isoform X2 [Alligator sinensis]
MLERLGFPLHSHWISRHRVTGPRVVPPKWPIRIQRETGPPSRAAKPAGHALQHSSVGIPVSQGPKSRLMKCLRKDQGPLAKPPNPDHCNPSTRTMAFSTRRPLYPTQETAKAVKLHQRAGESDGGRGHPSTQMGKENLNLPASEFGSRGASGLESRTRARTGCKDIAPTITRGRGRLKASGNSRPTGQACDEAGKPPPGLTVVQHQISTASRTQLFKGPRVLKGGHDPSLSKPQPMAGRPLERQHAEPLRALGKLRPLATAGKDLKLTRSPRKPQALEKLPLTQPKAASQVGRPRGPITCPTVMGRGKQNGLDAKRVPQPRPGAPRNCTTPHTSGAQIRASLPKRRSSTGRSQARRVPKAPTPANRKKQLEEWLASKGRAYKRPPMTLSTKKLAKKLHQSFWDDIKEEEETREQMDFAGKIHSAVSQCLKHIEEGLPASKFFTQLAQVPEAERSARFWICKAKMLAREGSFDVTELYEAAVRAGAEPIQELREVVVDLLKQRDKKSQGIPATPGPEVQVPTTPCPGQSQPAVTTPCVTSRHLPVSTIKLKVVPTPRASAPNVQLLTPVRRSLRIEHTMASYPNMLRDHDLVVSSLAEIAGGHIVICKNQALPEDVELEILGLGQ